MSDASEQCDCMAEDPGDGGGERVLIHSSTCRLNPEWEEGQMAAGNGGTDAAGRQRAAFERVMTGLTHIITVAGDAPDEGEWSLDIERTARVLVLDVAELVEAAARQVNDD